MPDPVTKHPYEPKLGRANWTSQDGWFYPCRHCGGRRDDPVHGEEPMTDTPEPLTTAEWMDLPLTKEDVDLVESVLNREHGVSSMFPWPTVHKVLIAARSIDAKDAEIARLRREVLDITVRSPNAARAAAAEEKVAALEAEVERRSAAIMAIDDNVIHALERWGVATESKLSTCTPHFPVDALEES